MRVKFVVDSDFVITSHYTDFDAIDSSLEDHVTPKTWGWVRDMLNKALDSGDPQRCACSIKCSGEVYPVVLEIEPRWDGLIEIEARSASGMPAEEVMEYAYQIVLLEPKDVAGHRIVHHAKIREEAVAYVDEWLKNSLGLVPAIKPMSVT